jgi:hypothetical protein
MTRVDTTHVYGIERLRHEYLRRHPGGGDFNAFLQRFQALREAVHGRHDPVRFYHLTFGDPDGKSRGVAAAHAAREGGTRAVLGVEGDDGEVSPSLPQDDAGKLALLQQAGLATGATSLQDALRELELPFMFAGREQWVTNVTRQDGAASIDPKLQNVTMESVLTEPNALNLLLGRAQDAVENGTSLAGDFAYWQSLVPEWAPRVRDQLAAQGIPFSVELLASPEINLTDPSKPLFGKDAAPNSLFGLGVHQMGERAFLRSLSAEELMTQVWPLYFQYYHRPAGSPVPAGFEAGLTFGSPVRNPDGTYTRSPLMSTDVYKRWAAYNQPGIEGGGTIRDDRLGLSWNPLTGEYHVDGDGQPASASAESVLSQTSSRVAAAIVLKDPSIYFAGPLAPYAPDALGEDARARLQAL